MQIQRSSIAMIATAIVAIIGTCCTTTSFAAVVPNVGSNDDFVVRLVLGNDMLIGSSKYDDHQNYEKCSDDDWALIDTILTTDAKNEMENSNGTNRRYLRSSSSSVMEQQQQVQSANYDENDNHRNLQSASCKDLCKGVVTAQCRVPGCFGFNKPSENIVLLDSGKDTDGNGTSTYEMGGIHGSDRLLLESNFDETIGSPSEGVDRALQSAFCKDQCKGVVTGQCRVPGCSGFTKPSENIVLFDSGKDTDKNGTSTYEMEGIHGSDRLLLERNFDETIRSPSEGVDRALQSTSCKDACRHYVPGFCHFKGCTIVNKVGMGNEPIDTEGGGEEVDGSSSTQTEGGNESNRMLREEVVEPVGVTCTDNEIKHMNQQINEVLRTKKISSTCQGLLKKLPRQYTCYYPSAKTA